MARCMSSWHRAISMLSGNFGGLPKVDRSYLAADVVDGKRMSVIETAEFIDELIQAAIDEPGLPFFVQDQATNSGTSDQRLGLWSACKTVELRGFASV